MSEVHQDQIGMQFKVTLSDADVAVDLSIYTTRQIIFKKPSGSLLTKTASLYTDGTDGIMYYTSVSGDLDEVGIWKLQCQLTNASESHRTEIGSFKVYGNL